MAWIAKEDDIRLTREAIEDILNHTLSVPHGNQGLWVRKALGRKALTQPIHGNDQLYHLYAPKERLKMKITHRPSAGRQLESLTWYHDVQLTGPDLFYPNVLLQTGGYLIQPLLETVQSTGVSTTDTVEFEVPPCVVSTSYGKVFFFIYNTDNYFHFLYDAIPTLAQFLRLRETTEHTEVKLLMNPRTMYPFVRESLELLGITPNDIVIADAHARYGTVIVASSPTHEGLSNEPPHSSVWDVYARLRTLAGPPTGPLPKKIYVSRRSWVHGDTSNLGTNYTTRRRMLCEDDLVHALEAEGYTEIFCESLSMAEKIRLFSQTTHVVGAIGGGMCNLVFSPPETKVLCIGSPEFERINHRFLYTMNHTQLTMFRNTWSTSMLYRRAKVGDLIGEVWGEDGDELTLALSNGVAWTEGQSTKMLVTSKDRVTFLDEGLNSPWNFDVEECMKFIQ